MLLQHNEENQIRRDRDMERNPILHAGGNWSAQRKPVRLGMDRQPKSLTNSVAIRGIEPVRSGERRVFRPLHQPHLPQAFHIGGMGFIMAY